MRERASPVYTMAPQSEALREILMIFSQIWTHEIIFFSAFCENKRSFKASLLCIKIMQKYL